MTATQGTSALQGRRGIGTMYVGLALTVAATIAPYLTDALADHLEAGYPDYTQERVDAAVTSWLAILTTIGTLGVVCWVGTIRLVTSGVPWARWAATAALTVGTSVALTNLLVKDTSGDTGLPPQLGWLGLLPCLPGVIAVAQLWRQRPSHDSRA